VLGVINIFADAVLVGSAMLVAVTVAVLVVFTSGARNSPLLEIVPVVVAHPTPRFLVLLTMAANCRVEPEATLEFKGEM